MNHRPVDPSLDPASDRTAILRGGIETGSAWAIGWRAAFTTALLDASLPLLTSARSLPLVREIALGTAFATLALFVSFLLIHHLLSPFARRARIASGSLALAVSLALASAWGVLALDRPMLLHWGAATWGLALLLFSGVLAATVLFAEGLVRFPRLRSWSSRVARVAPLVACLLTASLLVVRCTSLVGDALVLAILVLASGSLAFLAYRFLSSEARSRANLGCSALAFAAILVGAVLLPAGNVLVRERLDAGRVPTPPRVILITVDTLRADALSCLGGTVPTPALDALFADSVVLENAQSAAPWTLPAFVSLLSGTSPWVHGATRFGDAIPEQLPHLAEFLRAAGYRTAGIGHNYFLTPRGTNGFASRGFEHYDFYPKGYHPWSVGLRLLQRLAPELWPQELDTLGLTDRALHWLGEHADDPFFFWVHYLDPHSPYEPPASFVSGRKPVDPIGLSVEQAELNEIRSGDLLATRERMSWIRELYQAEVKLVDREIARLVSFLKERGLYEDSLVLFVSDHGEEFFEHRSVEHGHSLHREVIHVPFAVKLPGGKGAGTRIGAIVSTESLAPTVLDVCGIAFPSESMTSTSLRPLLEGRALDGAGRAHATGLYSYLEREAIVLDGWKYVRSSEWSEERLYDLRQDPWERRDVALLEEARVKVMREELDRFVEHSRALRRRLGIQAGGAGVVGEDDRDRLRAIGY